MENNAESLWQRLLRHSTALISLMALLLALFGLLHSQALKEKVFTHLQRLDAMLQHELPALQATVAQHDTTLNQLAAASTPALSRANMEATQLIEQSQLIWQTTGSPEQTRRLLQLALAKLSSHQDPGSQTRCHALQTDLKTLDTLSAMSPVMRIKQLNQLMQQITQVALTPASYSPDASVLAPDHSWLNKLKGLVTVTKFTNDTVNSPKTLTRDQLRQSILAQLALTQWSVIQRDPSLYQHHLQAAYQRWQSLHLSSAAATRIEQQFSALQATPLQPDLSLQSWQAATTSTPGIHP